MPKGFVIAIDGPVASGKGSLASKLAKELSGFHLYTGAMYRSIALLCIDKGIDLGNESQVIDILPNLNIEFENGKILLNGFDITKRLQKPDTASGASVVGVHKSVREISVKKQREIAEKEVEKGKIVVAEGRDTGSVVFPNASIKIYLTARPEIRAKRRMEQYATSERDLQKELEELLIRDKRDQKREIDPLLSNPESEGYFILDNSDLNEQEMVDAVKKELKNRNLIT